MKVGGCVRGHTWRRSAWAGWCLLRKNRISIWGWRGITRDVGANNGGCCVTVRVVSI